MTKDEQLILQILQAYRNGTIDFSHVPALNELVHEQVNIAFNRYTEPIAEKAEEKLEQALRVLDQQTQDKLDTIDLDTLKTALIAEVQQEQRKLENLKADVRQLQEQVTLKRKRALMANWSMLFANLACLLAFFFVFVLLGRWVVDGVWKGWGLHWLFETTVKLQPEHPYGAVVLGAVGVGLIASAIYLGFRLVIQTTHWLDHSPKIFKKLFTKR
ncbi:mobilization protein [Enterococcus faecalis]